MAKWWGLGLILMALVILSQLDDDHHQAAAAAPSISCTQVKSKLLPCMPFLKGSASAPTASCCQGYQSLGMGYAVNEPDPDRRSRGPGRAMCECFKQVAKSSAVDVSRAKQISQLCQLNLPFLVDPNADCAKA